MPFDLWISRAQEFSHIAAAAEAPSFWARLIGSRPAQSLISEEAVRELMADAPAEMRPDGQSWWLRHINHDDPWALVRFTAPVRRGWGHLLLSISMASNSFLRNWGDCFDLALLMSRELDARVYEGSQGRIIDEDNIDALLDPHGAFVKEYHGNWKALRTKMEAEGRAPLEFPLGGLDSVAEFFCLYLHPERPLEPRQVREVLADLPTGMAMETHGERAFLLMDFTTGQGFTKVLLRPDGDLQIWPDHWPGPFPRVAPVTLDTAMRLQERLGGQVTFFRQPVDAELLSELRERCVLPGVEFYEWRVAVRG